MKRENVYTYFETINPEEFCRNYDYLQNLIKERGFSFEGKEFPYSLKPLIVTQDEENYFKESSEALLEILEIVLASFYSDPYVKSFFSNYGNYHNLLSTAPHGRKIVISRYDTVWYGNRDYKIFECNTCCPGGISILGTVKRNYINLPVAHKTLTNVGEFECDYTENFINALVEYSKTILSNIDSKRKLGIAFANYDNVYTYELKEFRECALSMGYNAVICDLKELKLNKSCQKLYFKDTQIDIVYIKADPLKLEYNRIIDFIDAIKNKAVASVNSFPAMYITESKIVLALLWDKYFQSKYLTKQQIDIIEKHIPHTIKLQDGKGYFKNNEIEDVIGFVKNNKNDLVLKIDNDTRGNNIFIGHSVSEYDWNRMIDMYKNKNWIIQEYCKIPEILIPMIDKNTQEVIFSKKRFGIDFMMYNGKYAGIVSRISEKEIINVGSGGCEQPVFVLK